MFLINQGVKKNLKMYGLHLYMFVKTNSINNLCVQTQNIVKYLYELLFSWGINDEQHSTVNDLHKILSNICVKYYFPYQDINVEQHSTVNGSHYIFVIYISATYLYVQIT